MTLTERRIQDAAPGPKTRIIWDTQFRNFGVRIAPGGRRRLCSIFTRAANIAA